MGLAAIKTCHNSFLLREICLWGPALLLCWTNLKGHCVVMWTMLQELWFPLNSEDLSNKRSVMD